MSKRELREIANEIRAIKAELGPWKDTASNKMMAEAIANYMGSSFKATVSGQYRDWAVKDSSGSFTLWMPGGGMGDFSFDLWDHDEEEFVKDWSIGKLERKHKDFDSAMKFLAIAAKKLM